MSYSKNKILAYQLLSVLLNSDGFDGEFSQVEIVKMYKNLGNEIGESTFSNFKRDLIGDVRGETFGGKPITISNGRLKKNIPYLEQIALKMLGIQFIENKNKIEDENENKTEFKEIKIEGQQEDILNISSPVNKTDSIFPKVVPYNIGRWLPDKKATFMQEAQIEIINFGLRLKKFTSYFEGFSKEYYKYPIEQLLEEGITIKCYLLDHTWDGAKKYFDDRAVLPKLKSESKSISIIKDSIEKLIELSKEFSSKQYKGKLEIYTYRHFPSNHFLSIDRNTPNAKMIVSPYIYGIGRGVAPQFIISKQEQPNLYATYLQSLETLLIDAQLQAGRTN